MPGCFIGIFHYIPSAFHCGFSLHTLCISLRFFIIYPVHFIVIFQMYPWVFHWSVLNYVKVHGGMSEGLIWLDFLLWLHANFGCQTMPMPVFEPVLCFHMVATVLGLTIINIHMSPLQLQPWMDDVILQLGAFITFNTDCIVPEST